MALRYEWSSAALLRALPELVDQGSVVRAEAVVGSLSKASGDELPMELQSAVFGLLPFLAGTPSISRACFMTVMASRMVFGDDRLVRSSGPR